MFKYDLTILLACLACNIVLQDAKSTSIGCLNKRTCRECIRAENCAWCMQPDHGDKPRCFQHSHEDSCPEEFIWNPHLEEQIIDNRSLTDATSDFSKTSDSNQEIVQMSPQHVSLKLRVNQEYSLTVNYSQAKDYPVDLYYLMDLSYSMYDKKEQVSRTAQKLSETMHKLTSQFRIGFGSFIDKEIEPFVLNYKKPNQTCLPKSAYGYRHQMSLSSNITEFMLKVENSQVFGSPDSPEGGFDAIMQAIACGERIGWHEQARRLLVFATDADFHFAGDGLIAGIIEPNDGKCHLDDCDYYSHSIIHDYPSVNQINKMVKENSINIIFAVDESIKNVYEDLSQRIEGSSCGILSSDSSNVVELVRREYNKFTASIEMKDNATSHVNITYHSACLSNGVEKPVTKCDGLKIGDVVSFTAKIKVTSCPTDPKDWNQVIQIYPVGINESLIIDLEMLCSCPCEHPGSSNYEIKSSNCSKNGNLVCGICECDNTHIGQKCECAANDMYSNTDNNKTKLYREHFANVTISPVSVPKIYFVPVPITVYVNATFVHANQVGRDQFGRDQFGRDQFG